MVIDLTVNDLLNLELSFGFDFKRTNRLSSNIDDSIREVRSLVITWILETRSYFAFRFDTVYLAVMYFDRYSSRREIDTENLRQVRLISIACISIAAKVEERVCIPLSWFPDGDYNLDYEMKRTMEAIVLDALDWKMHYTTPFCFLHFFITELCEPSSPPATYLLPTESISPFISAVMKEINLIETRPSTVGIAAVLMALDPNMKSRTVFTNRIRNVSFIQSIDIEDIFQCYILMVSGKRESIDFDGSTSSAPKRRRLWLYDDDDDDDDD